LQCTGALPRLNSPPEKRIQKRAGRTRDCSSIDQMIKRRYPGTGNPGPYRPRIPLFRCRTGIVIQKTGTVSASGGSFSRQKLRSEYCTIPAAEPHPGALQFSGSGRSRKTPQNARNSPGPAWFPGKPAWFSCPGMILRRGMKAGNGTVW